MGEAFESLFKQKVISEKLSEKMKRAVGFRNLAVHEYEKLDWAKVLEFVTNDVSDLKDFGKVISKFKGL